MKKFIFALLVPIIAGSAHAADTRATSLVVKGLSCELGEGKAKSVVKALKTLGAKPTKNENEYVLASPIQVFGLDVRRVVVSPSEEESPEFYIAVFPNGNPADIARAAKLKPLAGGYVRHTKTGHLSADVRDDTDVWLTCTPGTAIN